MDESIMLQWVDQVLLPYVENVPEGVVPILLLDSYRCHMMASVVNRIADLGVQVEHIPGGCTGLCQPIDVGIGKPLKSKIRDKWEAWMLEEGVDLTLSRPPERQQLAQWIIKSLEEISEGDIVRNCWRHTGYSFFDEEDLENEREAEEEAGAEVHEEDSSVLSGTSSNNMVLMTENSNINIDDSASSSFGLPETMALLSNLNDIERTLAAKSYSSGGGNRNDDDDLYSEFDDEEEHVNNSEPLF
jgi:hypothetical protein